MIYLHKNKISFLPHDFLHITRNCQTQSRLNRVENNVEELKHHCSTNTTFDSCSKHLVINGKCCTHWKLTRKTLQAGAPTENKKIASRNKHVNVDSSIRLINLL